MITHNQAHDHDPDFSSLSKDELISQIKSLQEYKRATQLEFAYRDLEQDKMRRLLSNKNLSSTQVRLFMVLINEVKRQRKELVNFNQIDVCQVEQHSGLSHSTISRELKRLESYGVFTRSDEFHERLKDGKRIIVDKVSIQFAESALSSPEEIRPGEGQERLHGGRPDRCAHCNSKKTRRIYHLICEECGHEDARYPDGWYGDRQSSQDELVADPLQVEQDAQVDGDRQSSQDEIADFVTRWCAVSGVSYNSVVSNPTAMERIRRFFSTKNLSTEELQSLYDWSYQKLSELPRAKGKKLVPPRLGNLENDYPEWSVTRRKAIESSQEQGEQEIRDQRGLFSPGAGWVPNARDGFKVDYSYFEQCKDTSPGGIDPSILNRIKCRRRKYEQD